MVQVQQLGDEDNLWSMGDGAGVTVHWCLLRWLLASTDGWCVAPLPLVKLLMTGPVGRCTEIFFDQQTSDPNEDRFLEVCLSVPFADYISFWWQIWNLVFMEQMQKADGSREALPGAVHGYIRVLIGAAGGNCVDTGMGLERVASVLQGKQTNYDVDSVKPLVHAVLHVAGLDRANYNSLSQDTTSVATRVIADHLRSTAFLLADGVVPSATGD
jgi:alanyl-tRNA synthetase